NLSLPPAQVTIYALGAAGVADASFVIAPVGPTTGHVDFATSQVTTTSRFDIRVAKVTPHPIPSGSPVAAPLTSKVNLAGSNCRTSTPITVTMGGTVDFVHGGTFSGTYAIPKFRDCKLMTAAINQMVPGGGNTFSATFSPPGTPAPPPAAAAAPAQFGLDAHAVAPTTPVPLPVPEPQVTTGVTGQLPVDAPPGAGTPIPVGNDTAGGTAQLPVSPPNPNGGLLGLLFQTR